MSKFFNNSILFFLISVLSACGTVSEVQEKNSANNGVNESRSDVDALTQTPEVNIVEEINKLDKRLSARLDNLERLIKTNHRPLPTKKVNKPVKANIEVTKASKPAAVQKSKIVVGEVEWVYLHELGQSFKTRVDSGATTSSISASNIQPFERDGKNWVKFTVGHRDTKKTEVIETPIVRKVRIKQASVSESQTRLVVSLNINLGEKLKQKAEFTLADRSDMVYPILLGREFLQDVTLIDVGKKFLHPKFKPEMK